MCKKSAKRARNEEASITLRCVGFCGADDSCEPELLAAVSAQYDWVEWGVLFRHDKEGEPRYASSAWLKRLAAVNSKRTMHLAGHLCSQRVDELLRGDATFVRHLHKEIGFNRVQINATAANNCDIAAFGSSAGADKCVAALRDAFAAVPDVEFILQRNRETKALWERLVAEPPPNMSLLFDDSMGLGVSTSSWPEPPSLHSLKFGYAGGLSPDNIVEKLETMDTAAVRSSSRRAAAAAGTAFIAAPLQHAQILTQHLSRQRARDAPPPALACLPFLLCCLSHPLLLLTPPDAQAGRTLWVDMETSLRTVLKDNSDIFDVNKAMRCVTAVIEQGRTPVHASKSRGEGA